MRLLALFGMMICTALVLVGGILTIPGDVLHRIGVWGSNWIAANVERR